VTDQDDDLRSRLRALRVFDVDIPTFDAERVPDDPAVLFRDWLVGAIDAGVRDPHAMTLSTIDKDGHPSSRVLLLKGLSSGHWQFATSRNSRKGRELAGTPWAAANFYWREIGRQVRASGRALPGMPEESARDFLARGADSRAESFAGNQSAVLADPAELDTALDDARTRVAEDPSLVSEHWTLYHLIPDEVEFWQADRARRHVRLRYQLRDQRWTRELLWP
jgi:pyridoxamine 5'-phosphate oxidase